MDTLNPTGAEHSFAGPEHVGREERFDQAIWTRYELAGGNYVILTSAGRELLESDSFSADRKRYVADMSAERESEEDTRRFMQQGQNGRVFAVGDRPLVIKERNPDGWGAPIEPALDRMDRLNHAIEKHCPHWVSMPQHYGLLVVPEDQREYLLMEKIDAGITVENVWNMAENAQSAQVAAAITENFGPISDKRREDIYQHYVQARKHVMGALKKEDMNPETYLPDFTMYNMLIEPLRTPEGGSRYKMWVIDQ